MTAIVLPFVALKGPAAPPVPDPLHVGVQTAEEAILSTQVLLACAPPALDRLEVAPAVVDRQGLPIRAVVIVAARRLDIIASADVMRRIAVTVDHAGRKGAALDLLQACDQAEALAAHCQRSVI